jgi:Uma2 family endonuclease
MNHALSTAKGLWPREDGPDTSKLITEDDTPVDNLFSEKQQRLLSESLYTSWDGNGRPFVAMANVGFYVSLHRPPLVPDLLLSLDVQVPQEVWEKPHRVYAAWEYGKVPEVVIEIVSNQDGGELSDKLEKYAQTAVAHYVVYDPQRLLSDIPLRLYTLQGRHYVETESTWLNEAQLGLTLWKGTYEGLHTVWLRWTDSRHELILNGAERVAAEKERAEKLAARLRELGIEI